MRNTLKLLPLAVFALVQACACDKNTPSGGQQEAEKIKFIDEFESFNESVWTKESHEPGWVNQELQYYEPAYVSVGKDGDRSVLIITAERKDGKIYSGRINSRGKMDFRYGTVEASIRLPLTDGGLWPAFWLMGDNGTEWPQCGEIDIMEMGQEQGILAGTSESYLNTAIHYGTHYADDHRQEYYAADFGHNLEDGNYHTYKLEWTENSLVVSVDGIRFHSYDISGLSGRHEYFQHEYYILFNMAVGGAFTGILDMEDITALEEGGKACMYVDWVKIY